MHSATTPLHDPSVGSIIRSRAKYSTRGGVKAGVRGKGVACQRGGREDVVEEMTRSGQVLVNMGEEVWFVWWCV